MGRVADTRYRTYPWDEPQGTRGAYEAPFGTTEYDMTREALDDVTALHSELETLRMGDIPPRFGYDRTARGIGEILSTARLYPDQSHSLSGTEGGYTGSPRNYYGGSLG